jgi:hypothetical protein
MKYFRNKIRWFVVVVALMAMPAVAEVRDTIDFDINDRSLETITIGNETFNQYSYPDCDHIDQTGAPMLPVKYIRLSVPHNATNITVTGAGSWTSEALGRRIYPAPEPLTTNDTIPEEPELVIDSAIYMTDAYWPPAAAELVGEGFYMGENHIITVAVYPMLYNPVQNKMHNYTQVRVKVSYDPGGTPANILVRYDNRLRQQELQQTKSLVANPQQVEAHAIPASTVHHMMMQQNPDTTDWPVPGYEYMVITTRELAPAFKRLIALKQQKGYRAGVVCVEDIMSDTLNLVGDSIYSNTGNLLVINDSAAVVRRYLRRAFDLGLKYTLIGGRNMPYRYAGTYQFNDHDTPTDWYFTDLTTYWIVKQYGASQYYKLNSISGSDIIVGRLMAVINEDVYNYSKKLLTYELNPGNGAMSYLQNCLVVEGSELNPKTSTGHFMADAYSLIFNNISLIVQSGHNYPTGSQVIGTINNNGYGLLSIHGHGSPYTIATNNWNRPGYTKTYQRLASLDSLDAQFVNNGLDLLRNKYQPCVFYSWSCNNAPFDVFYEPYLDKHYTNWNMAQSFLMGKDYGGVAFLGNSRVGYYSSDTIRPHIDYSPLLEKMFSQAICEGHYKIGDAENYSKYLYNSGSKVHLCLSHNLHGDPELEMWTGVPSCYNQIIQQQNDNSITLSNLGTNMVIVGLNDGMTQKMDSTATGSITINNVNPNSTVMAYRHNYLPYIAPLYLQNERVERSQYVIANDVFAGRNVDSNRTEGDLTIAEGSEYEIETKGQVLLAPGFKVEKGALFSVTQSDY